MNLLGYPFTWERGAGTNEWIEIRLDRALVTMDFMNMFTDGTLTNFEVSTSDHCPFLLERFKTNHVVQVRNFRFENAWLREPMCQQLVEEVWNRNKDRSFYDKLMDCTEVLSTWGQKVTGSFKK